MTESFHRVQVYQITMAYTLNILKFYLSIIPHKVKLLNI